MPRERFVVFVHQQCGVNGFVVSEGWLLDRWNDSIAMVALGGLAWRVIGSNKVQVHGCEGEGKEGTVVVLYGRLLVGSLNAGRCLAMLCCLSRF